MRAPSSLSYSHTLKSERELIDVKGPWRCSLTLQPGCTFLGGRAFMAFAGKSYDRKIFEALRFGRMCPPAFQ